MNFSALWRRQSEARAACGAQRSVALMLHALSIPGKFDTEMRGKLAGSVAGMYRNLRERAWAKRLRRGGGNDDDDNFMLTQTLKAFVKTNTHTRIC